MKTIETNTANKMCPKPFIADLPDFPLIQFSNIAAPSNHHTLTNLTKELQESFEILLVRLIIAICADVSYTGNAVTLGDAAGSVD